MANMLFSLDQGIKSVYLGHDFVTVTKYAEAHWQHLQTPIFSAIMDFYGSGQPALREQPEITDTTIFDDDDEVVAMIKELLETRIRPAVLPSFETRESRYVIGLRCRERRDRQSPTRTANALLPLW